jgi:hypothetical protein
VTVEEPFDGTGDARVDGALRRLDGLDDLALADHVERYEDVHNELQDALNAVEQD